MKILFLLIVLFTGTTYANAQIPEAVFSDKIKSAQFYGANNQLVFPIIRLGSGEQIDLHFDDLEGNVKNLSYTFQLCNADWTPAMMTYFDFIKGFSQVRITNYRMSSVAYTRYTHYQAKIPDRNCIPSRSGNYILKVFMNGDTSKLLLTKKMYVLEEKATIPVQIQQPFNGTLFQTHQKLNFKVNMVANMQMVNPQQQVSATIIQNNRTDNAAMGIRPQFFSRNTLDFNTERDAVFPAGKEWRWVDLRSFRFFSDRVANGIYNPQKAEIYLRIDPERTRQQFNFYRDINGRYSIETTESLNPFWQTDYATVKFAYMPDSKQPLIGKDVYLFGELTGYKLDEKSKMIFNQERGVYESDQLLKQGYYDYQYVTVDASARKPSASFEETEGNFWETENDYVILIYYRELGGRADELVGYTNVNSRLRR